MEKHRIIKKKQMTEQTALPVFAEQYTFSDTTEISLHSHEFLEIGITTKGSALHYTPNGIQRLTRNSVYLIPPGQNHYLDQMEHWHVTNIYLLSMPFLAMLNSFSLDYTYLQQFLLQVGSSEQLPNDFVLSSDYLNSAEKLFDAYFLTHPNKKTLRDIYQSTLLLNVLILLCDSLQISLPTSPTQNNTRILQLTAMIHEHIDQPSSPLIEHLSKEFGYHPNHLNRIAKNYFHCTLSNYIQRCKIEKSIHLLMMNTPVTEIAHMLGFYDHAHFNKYFVKYVGMSPLAYKDQWSVL